MLARTDKDWLVTRCVPPAKAAEAVRPADGDVKVLIELGGDGGNS